MAGKLSKPLIVLCLLFLLFSCVETPPVVEHLATGSIETKEWTEYNERAQKYNSPILKYFVFTNNLSSDYKPEKITDSFTLSDKRGCFYSEWGNIAGYHVASVKIYDPRGVLFNTWDSKISNRPHSSMVGCLEILNCPASKLPGKWTFELFMDQELAIRKQIVVGHDNLTVNRISYGEKTHAIAVSPFIVEGKGGDRHRWRMPTYIANMLSIDYPEHRVILPWWIFREISFPPNAKLDPFINSLIKSSRFDLLMRKYKVNLFIAGSAYDSNKYGETNEFRVYIINAKEKVISKKVIHSWVSNEALDSAETFSLEPCREVYSKIIEQAKSDIENILKTE